MLARQVLEGPGHPVGSSEAGEESIAVGHRVFAGLGFVEQHRGAIEHAGVYVGENQAGSCGHGRLLSGSDGKLAGRDPLRNDVVVIRV